MTVADLQFIRLVNFIILSFKLIPLFTQGAETCLPVLVPSHFLGWQEEGDLRQEMSLSPHDAFSRNIKTIRSFFLSPLGFLFFILL